MIDFNSFYIFLLFSKKILFSWKTETRYKKNYKEVTSTEKPNINTLLDTLHSKDFVTNAFLSHELR